MLRAGLIGLGAMGRHHARVLQSLEGVELVAVAEPAPGQAQVATLPAGLPVVSTVADLLAIGVDYCVVASPTTTHQAAALELAAAGVHALVEKPLAPTSEAARTIADAFADAGLVGGVGHIERFNPAMRQARERIARGDLGQILQVATRRLSQFPPRIGDVGVLLDLASHDIDAAMFLTSGAYRQVSGHAVSAAGRHHEDLVSAVGVIDAATPIVVSHVVNWLSPFKERSTVITGSNGVFVIDTLTADLTFYANAAAGQPWDDVAQFRGVSEGDVTRFAFGKPEPLAIEHAAFRDAVCRATGRPVPASTTALGVDIVTLASGAQVVAVARAIADSATSGTAVTLA